MALDDSALLDVLEALKGADVEDRMKQAATTVYQALIEAELSSVIGAGLHERSDSRTTQRNGHRPKTLTTTAGDLQLQIPKLRTGSFFPSLLERRRRVDQSLFAVIMEAYLHGTSTRKVDDLVKALGADTGIFKSEVSCTVCNRFAATATASNFAIVSAAFVLMLTLGLCWARLSALRPARSNSTFQSDASKNR